MKVAVIGSGIAGLSAAWMLHRSGQADLTVFEAGSYVGGHSNTVDAPGRSPGETVPVDTGFIVLNDRTYPHLNALFREIDVAIQLSNMSFAVSVGNGAREYSGNPQGLFAQRRNLLRPSHFQMLKDIVRFYRAAPRLLTLNDGGGVSLGDYLKSEGYSDAFVRHHLLPMGAAIWSTTVRDMMAFPVRSFVQFFHNHGLLTFRGRPTWSTVTGGSRAYVEKLSVGFRDRIRLNTPVAAISRRTDGVEITLPDGEVARFDQVIVAAHADQALSMLATPTRAERRLLSAFRYTDNRAILHSDPALMPKRRKAWASWNYIGRNMDGPAPEVSVTYWMNLLQGIDADLPLFVSLNPLDAPDPSKIVAEFDYAHPMFDAAAVAAQERLGEIQGADRIWYCGSYFGFGFHEDGCASGLAVGEAITGTKRPWVAQDVSPAGPNAQPKAPAESERLAPTGSAVEAAE